MQPGGAELAACLASLDSLLSKVKRLVIEYDMKIRKNPRQTSDYDVAQLENAISFAEVRSLDELCRDAIARWIPQRPEIAEEWFVNEFKGLGSPEDLERELEYKRTRLDYALHLYQALSTIVEGQTVTDSMDVPYVYKKLGDSLSRFFADSSNRCDVYDRNVFIMTRFLIENRELAMVDKTIHRSLDEKGLVGHRADNKCYPSDRNLWDNVCTYMFGCKYGVAVLENLVVDEFNPNIALEYGFMRALGKPVLLLKEKRFSPRADILGTLWEEFDMFDIESSISAAVGKWYNDLALE